MKKAIIICVLLALLCAGCSSVTAEPWTHGFSYAEELERFSTDGAKQDGFHNTVETEIVTYKDAIELAKLECTISYDEIHYAYDETADMWFILFSSKNTLGGSQSVYLNGQGITAMIVYGK